MMAKDSPHSRSQAQRPCGPEVSLASGQLGSGPCPPIRKADVYFVDVIQIGLNWRSIVAKQVVQRTVDFDQDRHTRQNSSAEWAVM